MVAEEEGAGLARGPLDDVVLGGKRGFAVDAFDGVGGRVELALEDTLLDVPPGEVFVADDLAFASELLGVGEALDSLNGDFNADAIDGPDILDDLVNQAAG